MSDQKQTNGNGDAAPKRIATMADFKKVLFTKQKQLTNLLPDQVSPERYLTLAMLAIYREPKLQQACIEAPDTVIDSILRGAQCGFEIGGPVPGAHLVPFYGKVPGQPNRKAMQCVMIPDYRGLISLAIDSGSIVDADPWLVYEGETFRVRGGTNRGIDHDPDYTLDRDDDKITHAYIVFTLPNGTMKFHVMSRADIDRVRASSKASDSGPWVQWYGQMALKTVVKRGLKTVPMNPSNAASKKLALAIEADNRFETGEAGSIVPEWGEDEDTASTLAAERTKSNLESLRERIHGRDVTEQAEAQAQEQAVRRTVAPNDAEPWPDGDDADDGDDGATEEPEPGQQQRTRQQPTTQRRGASRQQAQRAAAAAAPRPREPGEDDDDEMP